MTPVAQEATVTHVDGSDRPHPPANEPPAPQPVAPAGPSFPPPKQAPAAMGDPAVGSDVQQAITTPPPMGDLPAGSNHQQAIGSTSPREDSPAGPLLADPVLGLLADVLDDLEATRIANANRLRQLTDTSDLGHGLSLENKAVRRLAQLVDALEQAEHQAVLSLRAAMREHPLGAWVKATPGVGEKQGARLLAAIRDPYWNDLHQRPRTVSELWAYCGLHTVTASQGANATHRDTAGGTRSHAGDQVVGDTRDVLVARVAPTRRRGQRANWNSQARQRVWLIAESCVKTASSPYRDVYDSERLKYADAVHAVPCARCGPAGTPAPAGSLLSAGHQHGRAMRRMSKEILRDLWREAARIHAAEEAA